MPALLDAPADQQTDDLGVRIARPVAQAAPDDDLGVRIPQAVAPPAPQPPAAANPATMVPPVTPPGQIVQPSPADIYRQAHQAAAVEQTPAGASGPLPGLPAHAPAPDGMMQEPGSQLSGVNVPGSYTGIGGGPPPAAPAFDRGQAARAQAEREAPAAIGIGKSLAAGPINLGKGLRDVYTPTAAESRARGMGIEHGMSIPGGEEMTPDEKKQAANRAIKGVAEMLEGGGQTAFTVGVPEMAGLGAAAAGGDAAAIATLAKIGATVGVGTVASEGAGAAAKKLNLSPEAQELAKQATFWTAAGLAGMAAKFSGVEGPAGAKGVRVEVPGGGVDVGYRPKSTVETPSGPVEVPRAAQAGVNIGGSRFSVRTGEGPQGIQRVEPSAAPPPSDNTSPTPEQPSGSNGTPSGSPNGTKFDTGPFDFDAYDRAKNAKPPTAEEKDLGVTRPEVSDERPVVQGSTDPDEIRASAKEQEPALKDMAAKAVEGVDGAEVVGSRVKDAESQENKADRNKPHETNIDHLGARIAVETPEARAQVAKNIEAQLPVASKDKIDNNGLDADQYGITTGKPGEANQVSELQVVPKAQAEAMKQTDDLYDQQKKAMAAGDQEKADEIGEQITKIHQDALAGGDNPTKYDFGSTQHNIPDDSDAGKALNAVRAGIDDADLAGKGKDIGDNHVTVRYGIQDDATGDIEKYLRSQAPFTAKLGDVSSFPPSKNSDGAAVLKAEVQAPELHRMNDEIQQHGNFKQSDFPDYKPHATIAYVKPESVDKYTGSGDTSGKTFEVRSVAISDRQGNLKEIPLEGAGNSQGKGDAGKNPEPAAEGGLTPSASAESSPQTLKVGDKVTLPDGRKATTAFVPSPSAQLPVHRFKPEDGGKPVEVRARDMGGVKRTQEEESGPVEGVTSGIEGKEKPEQGAIAVDLDNTLASYNGYKGPTVIGDPLPEVENVKKLLAEGKDVWVYSARAKDPEAVTAIKAWTKEHIGQELPVTNVKYDEFKTFIDDRAQLPTQMQEGGERGTKEAVAKPAEAGGVRESEKPKGSRFAKRKPAEAATADVGSGGSAPASVGDKGEVLGDGGQAKEASAVDRFKAETDARKKPIATPQVAPMAGMSPLGAKPTSRENAMKEGWKVVKMESREGRIRWLATAPDGADLAKDGNGYSLQSEAWDAVERARTASKPAASKPPSTDEPVTFVRKSLQTGKEETFTLPGRSPEVPATPTGWDEAGGPTDDPRQLAVNRSIAENIKTAKASTVAPQKPNYAPAALVNDDGFAVLSKHGVGMGSLWNGIVLGKLRADDVIASLEKSAPFLKSGEDGPLKTMIQSLQDSRANGGHLIILSGEPTEASISEEQFHGWQMGTGVADDRTVQKYVVNHPLAKKVAKELFDLNYRINDLHLSNEVSAKAAAGALEKWGASTAEVGDFLRGYFEAVKQAKGDALATVPQTTPTVTKQLEAMGYGTNEGLSEGIRQPQRRDDNATSAERSSSPSGKEGVQRSEGSRFSPQIPNPPGVKYVLPTFATNGARGKSPIAESTAKADNVTNGERTPGVDTSAGGRKAPDSRSEDRAGVAAVPSEVLPDAESRRDVEEGDTSDRVAVRRGTPSVSKPGAEPGPGAGGDPELDRTPAGPTVRAGQKQTSKAIVLNRNWYAHPEGWKPPTGDVGRLEANLNAVRIVRDIEKSPRKLTDTEKEALANYVGWGALQHAFAPWSAPRDQYTKWKAANDELQKLLTPDELARAQESTKNAHYTSPELVRFMWDTMQRFGFKAGNVLEPSVGTGNFLGMMPKSIRGKVNAVANEMDSMSHAIAKLLYPEATHFNKDFADLLLPNNDVDVAIGNPPFGGYKLYDPAYKKLNALVHDFFFVKSLDKVRPGGVLAFITSTGTMDKADSGIRALLASKANLLGAIRLPSRAFKANAGTDVTTDLIFLQKRAPGEPEKHADDWMNSTETNVPGKYGDMEKLNLNEYFQRNPEMMLGRPTASTKMYGGMGFVLEQHADKNITDLLKEAQKALPRGIFRDDSQKPTGFNLSTTIEQFAPTSLKPGQFTVDAKGDLKQNVDGKLVKPETVLDKAGAVQPAKVERFKALVGVRNSMNTLLASMMTEPNDEAGNSVIAGHRAELQKQYDDFVKKYGYINGVANNGFRDDPHYPRLLALENWDKAARQGTPADIFRRRTIFPREELRALPDNPQDALQLVLAERGFPDISMMARLSGKEPNEIAKTLTDKGLIYRNPASGAYETRETYLSGHVRDKLRDAQRAVKQGMKEYEPNIAALEKAVLPDIEIGDDPEKNVSVRLGATWIPTDAIQDFIRDTFKTRGTVQYLMGNWKVDGLQRTAEVTGEFGTPSVDADTLLENALNQKQTMVYGKDADGKSYVDRDKTTLAQAAQAKIQQEFSNWTIRSSWKPELQRLYNNAYNNLAHTEYDGSHLTFPGKNPAITLQPHQVNAIWRGVQDGRALLAHEVGAGKTFEMAGIAMESRRVGTAKKPMIAVPNHIVEQFRQEFLHLYPGANLLVPTEKDFDSKNRQRIMSRIATGDYDAIILPHSQFNLMDISPERQKVTINRQKDELSETIRALKAARGEKRTVKQLETAMAKLDASLKKLSDLKADKAIYFDDLGVDQLIVDEAHLYKNLSFYTKMTRIAGLQQAKAKSALRLKMKTEFLQDRNAGRGVIFATGTPVQNTMAELYTMMKYVAPDVLEHAGIRFFDDLAANFGQVITAMELAADGRSYKARAKFAQFQNVPELMNMFRSFADVKTAEDLNLPTPELETGKAQVVSVPASDKLEAYVKDLMARAEAVKSGQVKPEEDNMLAITTDGRKAATDMRLVGQTGDDPDSKINTAVERLYQEWKEGKNNPQGPATQMAFLDLYRSLADDWEGVEGKLMDHAKANKVETLNLYKDMRDKLVSMGIPKEHIAIIGDYDTRLKRQALFAAMNRGDVRILLGSTQKMGAGTNAQRLLKVLHHIDLTWRPGDLAQRNGRIMRQGNLNPSVRILNYLTERSFDAYMAQTLQGKATFISQLFSGKSNQRVMSDVASDMVLSLEEMKIAASGNPDVKLHYDLQMKKSQLQSLERSWDAQRRSNEFNAQMENGRIQRIESDIKQLESAQKRMAAVQGDGEEKKLEVKVDGKTFTDREELTKYLEAMDVPPGNFHMTINGINVAVETDRLDPAQQKARNESSLDYTLDYDSRKFQAPRREMLSLVRSIEARMRNVPDDLESEKIQLPKSKEKARRLQELAERKDFPEKDELDKIEKELKAVEVSLGMRSDVENAMAQQVTADVADDDEDEPENEGEDEEDENETADVDAEKDSDANGVDRVKPDKKSAEKGAKLGTKLYSGFADPELFKALFPSVANRIGEWLDDDTSIEDLQKGMMRETRGQMDRRVAIVMQRLSGELKAWRSRSREDSMKFWNAVESGDIYKLSPADQALAGLFRGAFDQMRKEIQQLKPEALQDYIENYFPHLWERQSRAAGIIKGVLTGKRPFAGRASFLKKRSIPTMQDGIDMGLTPKTWNPVEGFLLKYAEMAQFLMGHQTLQVMKQNGTAKYVRLGQKPPDGYIQLDDRIASVYRRAQILDEDHVDDATYDKPYAGGTKTIPSIAVEDIPTYTGTVLAGHYYAPEDAARVFNNFVSRGLAGRSTVYDILNAANNNLNALQLGISAYHAATTSINAATSDVALGIQQLTQGKPLQAGASMAKGLAVAPSMVRTLINGTRLMREYLTPGSYAAMAKEAAAIAEAGGRIKQNNLDLKPLDAVVNAWKNGAIREGLTKVPGAILEATVRPVMEYYVPRMKLGAFYSMAHNIFEQAAKENWNHEQTRQRLQKAWDSIDNRFGQLVYDNLFWHKGLRDALNLAQRSVGWNFGDFRELGGAVHDTAKQAGRAATGRGGEITDRMAFAIALPIVTALIGAVLTKLWTGENPQTWKDYFYPRTADGTRHSIPGYMKDVVAFVHDPVSTVENKLAPIWSLTAQAIQNRDFYGTEIRHKDDGIVKQLGEFSSWLGKQVMPFSLSSTAKLLEQHGGGDSLGNMLHEAGKHPGDIALGNFGFQKAPAYIQNSEALNMAREYELQNRPPGTKTLDQSEHNKAFADVVKMYRDKNVDQNVLDRYRTEGKMPGFSIRRAAQESNYAPIVISSRGLSIEQILNVYDKATPEEKQSLRPLVHGKGKEIAQITDPDRRKDVLDSYQRAMREAR